MTISMISVDDYPADNFAGWPIHEAKAYLPPGAVAVKKQDRRFPHRDRRPLGA
jgi:hypothetical protein